MSVFRNIWLHNTYLCNINEFERGYMMSFLNHVCIFYTLQIIKIVNYVFFYSFVKTDFFFNTNIIEVVQ